HPAPSRYRRSEAKEADVLRYIHIHGFHAPAPEIGFVPESGSTGVFQELPPPCSVGIGTRPGLERPEIPPILAHSHVWGKQRKQAGLVQEQTVRFGLPRFLDFRPE